MKKNILHRSLLTGLSSSGGSIIINNYLTIEALEDGLTASLSLNDCEYCVDGDGNWKTLAAGTTTEAINTGHTLSFRAELTPVSSKGIGTFTISNKCNLKGDCKSLLYGDNASAYTNIEGKLYAFYKLFNNCTTIITVSENFLPENTIAPQYCYAYMFYGCSGLVTVPSILVAKTANYNCYQYMFRGCTSLTTAPELPATILLGSCYEGMFYGCKALTTAPELPATSIDEACYKNMFYGCISLTTAPELPATIDSTYDDYCYSGMFRGCTKLTSAPELPSKTVSEYCYQNMFYGCTSLTTAPELPATTTKRYCYSGMFRGCTKLTSAPKLATSSYTSAYCYEYMFYGCKALKVAPELPATNLSSCCYQYMFYGCTNLTTAPELPATTIVVECYRYMFQNCTSLITAPDLPATTLAERCYNYMFKGCTKLNYIKMLATDISATSCLWDWVDGVSTTGTFVKNSAMTTLPTGTSGIPEGWTVQNT